MGTSPFDTSTRLSPLKDKKPQTDTTRAPQNTPFPKPQGAAFAQQPATPFKNQQTSAIGKPTQQGFATQQTPFGKPQTSPVSNQQKNPFASFQQSNATKSLFGTQQAKDLTQTLSAFKQSQPAAKTGIQTPFVSQNKKQTSFAAKPTELLNRQQTSPLAQKNQSPFSMQRPTQQPATMQRSFFRPSQTPSDQARGAFQSKSPFSARSSFSIGMSLTNEEFILIRDFIYKKCGIFIAENRKYLIENRLSARLKHLNLKNYTEYYKYLKFDTNKDAELNELYVLMTTNETSFFRNPPQLKVFQDVILTNIIGQIRKTGQKRLRIWSAGCSTGEEPYTLAIIISEVLKGELASWDVRITANDLSTQVLLAARQGLYSEYSLRTTPKEYISKYFTKDGQVYKINANMKRLIAFDQINLNERDQLRRVENSHIVFCRNVIIYFDDDMKRRVINAFYDNLLPGGALLIGHSETLHNICRSFELEHYAGTIVYRKRG